MVFMGREDSARVGPRLPYLEWSFHLHVDGLPGTWNSDTCLASAASQHPRKELPPDSVEFGARAGGKISSCLKKDPGELQRTSSLPSLLRLVSDHRAAAAAAAATASTTTASLADRPNL